MPGIIALTGATGFIGRAILDNLIKNGYKVRALTRSPRNDQESIQWINGDLNNQSALLELVHGADSVIHCAGSVRGNSLKAFINTNVTGTSNLVQAATLQKVKPRFLLISSLAAREPQLSWYAESKLMAEQSVVYYPDGQWTIFRPTAVYGAGDKELKPVFSATRHGLLPVVGSPSNNFSLLHIDDLVAAIQCWLSAITPSNGIYELDDGNPEGYSYQSIATITQEIWGHSVRCITIPTSLVHLIAYANLWLAMIFDYAPMLTPGKVRELQHPNWLCNNKPLIEALPGWQPHITLRNALPLLF
ncbi:MAG: NAD(P)-dependent oxidoreductase [Nitrosomonas sp.]|nr:NAD(P)-dependent oxidoreductase [Nitrosomonas sp.]MDP1950588.1 NAD(P)-dependent oxidoreductase [Nitrosomonas sp.]